MCYQGAEHANLLQIKPSLRFITPQLHSAVIFYMAGSALDCMCRWQQQHCTACISS